MGAFTEYHEKLRCGENTDTLWENITALYRKMTGYTFGVRYDDNAEIRLIDAMERAQLKTLYFRCLAHRPAKA